MPSKFCLHFVCVWYKFRVKDCLSVQESKVNTKPISTIFLGTITIGEQNVNSEGSTISNFNISFTSLLTVSSKENGMERFLTYVGFSLNIQMSCSKTLCYTWFIL